MDACRPPIEAILFDQEEIMCFQSLDYVAFNENLRRKVPTNVLVDRISELNDDLAIRNNELGYSLEYRLTKFCQKNAYNDELVVQYEGPKEEPIPPELDLGDQEEIMCFQSLDYVAFNENLRRKVPTNVLVDRISELNDDLAIRNNELGYSLEYRLTKFCQKNAYNDELVVQYEGPKEEPIPPELDLGDFCPIKFSPFDYFCLPQRKLAAERREYEMSFRDLPYHYGNT